MSVDVASLAIRVDATQPQQAATSLDNLTAAGKKTEAQADKVTSAHTKLAAETRKVTDSTDQLTKATGGASNGLSFMKAGLAGAVGGAVAAGLEKIAELIGEIARKTIDLVKESALLSARFETLGVVLHVAGNNAGYTAVQMDAFEEAVKRNGITGIEARASLTSMATAHLDLAKAAKLSRVAQDVAVVGNINSSEAFGRLVDGLQTGNVLMLRTLGINVDFQAAYERTAKALHTTTSGLTESEMAQARLNAVLEEGKNFAGIYGEAMGTAGKQVTSMSRYSEEAKQSLGDLFLPETTSLIFDQAAALQAVNEQLAELSRSDVTRFIGGVLVFVFKALEVTITGVVYIGGQWLRLLGAMASEAAALARGDFAAVGDIGKSFQKDYDAAAASYEKLLNRQLGLAEAASKAASMTEAERIAHGKAGAAATAQAEKLAALGKAMDTLNPKAKKIAELQAGIDLVRVDLKAGVGDAAAEKAAIAAGEKEIATLQKSKEHHDRRAESLAREAAAMSATTAATLALAVAYGVSDAAAAEAQARVEAIGKAIKSKGDQDAYVARQAEANAAKAAAESGKEAADLKFSTDARAALNAQVAAGVITTEQADAQLSLETTLRSKVAAAVNAHGKALEVLTANIAKQRAEQARSNATAAEAAALQDSEALRRQITTLQAEAGLIGASNAQRAIEIAQIEERAKLLAKPGADPNSDAFKGAVDDAGRAAAAAHDLQVANDNYNASLTRTSDLLQEIAAHTQAMTQGLSSSLGQVGGTISALMSGLTQYKAVQEQLSVEEKARIKAAQVSDGATAQQKMDAAKQIAAVETLYAQKRQNAEEETNLGALQSFKSLFSEKSSAYKLMTGLEVAYQAITLAGHAKEIALDIAHTAGAIGRALARAAAKGVEAIANAMSSIPFPLNLAAAAATAAALVAFGVQVFGGGGGSSSGATDAADRQKAQGAGTVLGDVNAKSDSIQKSLDLVAKNTNQDLEYSNGMLRALRSIDNNIGLVAASLAQSLGAGGQLDTSKLNLGTSVTGPGLVTKLLSPLSLLLPGLFGSKSTSTLQDQGIQFTPQALGSVIASGISGAIYQQVATETKKSFLGITYSDKTSTSTQTQTLDSDLARQITALIGSLKDGVLSAAGVLGISGAEATLNAFTVSLGKLSLKDMTGDQITAALNAEFSKLGDDLASAVMPSLAQFQKVGEGAFETLARVAREYQVVDVSLQSIGKTFGAVGAASIAARDSLVNLFASLDDFTAQTQFFADNFLTDAQRIAPIQAAVSKEFARLGVTGVNTKDQFAQLVLGLDLTTAAGQQMYAAMLAVAPAFAKVMDYLTGGSKDVTAATDALTKAYQAEADALQQTIDKFQSFSDSLKAFRASLDTGPNALLSPEAQYNATKAAFEDTAAKAKLGDATALGDLQNVSQSYLDASKAYYASSGKYFQDLAAVKAAVTASQATAQRTVDNATQQLTALQASVSGLITINQSVLSVHDAIVALQAALAAAGVSATTTPFSPLTNATGSTVPSYTYTPPVTATPVATDPTTPTYDPNIPLTPAQIDALIQANMASGYATGAGGGGREVDGFNVQMYAAGGVFTNGIVSQPTSFNNSQMGEAGPEAIMPLVRGPNGLGVRSAGGANDNSALEARLDALIEVTKAQSEEIKALRVQVARGDQANVEATDRAADKTAQAIKAPTTPQLAAGGRAR